jgi:signal transduction histidine kinase
MWQRYPYPRSQEACRRICECLCREQQLALATIWSLDPVRRRLILVAWHGGELSRVEPVMQCDNHFSGSTADHRQIRWIEDVRSSVGDGTVGDNRRTFFHPELIESLGLRQMVSLPIVNRPNPHQLLFVLNLFPSVSVSKQKKIRECRLFLEADRPNEYLEQCLRHECNRAATRVHYSAIRHGGGASPRTMCHLLARALEEKLPCDAAVVFIEDTDDDRAELLGFAGDITPIMSNVAACEELATSVWTRNREVLFDRVWNVESGSQVAEIRSEGVCVPLRDAFGVARGAIMLINSRSRQDSVLPCPYSYEHIAILESMGSAFATRLEVVLAERRRSNAMARLTHEMRMPITAFRAGIAEIKLNLESTGKLLEHDYLGDLETYVESMARNVRELNLLQKGRSDFEVKKRPTLFESEILQPARRFVDPLLRQRRFDPKRIELDLMNPHHERVLPELDLDRVLMTQVVFNLLENAIKFAKDDPSLFNLWIIAKHDQHQRRYEIVFRDSGIGVSPGYDERIFHEGARGPNAWKFNVIGDGLGLFVAREFVRLHGGNLEYRQGQELTEFAILLPDTLAVV